MDKEKEKPVFSTNGYWTRTGIASGLLYVLYVENDFDTYVYDIDNREWIARKPCYELGMDDDYDKVTEQEALDALGIKEW